MAHTWFDVWRPEGPEVRPFCEERRRWWQMVAEVKCWQWFVHRRIHTALRIYDQYNDQACYCLDGNQELEV